MTAAWLGLIATDDLYHRTFASKKWCKHCDADHDARVFYNRDAWVCLACEGVTDGIDEFNRERTT